MRPRGPPNRVGPRLRADVEMFDVERRQPEMIVVRTVAFGRLRPIISGVAEIVGALPEIPALASRTLLKACTIGGNVEAAQ